MGAPVIMHGNDVVTEGDWSSWAVFSADRVYRYLLGRFWDYEKGLFWRRPCLTVGMLNPSKAGAYHNDPTVRRVIRFGKDNDFGGVIVWNANALVSTNPRGLRSAADPVGPRNPEAMKIALCRPLLVKAVVAWGRPLNRAMEHHLKRVLIEARMRRPLWSFGPPTKGGWPRHPLYLRADTPIQEY